MKKWQLFVNFILRPEWIVFGHEDSDEQELGLKIWGVIFALYKGYVYIPTYPINIRKPEKREFGESLYKPTNDNHHH